MLPALHCVAINIDVVGNTNIYIITPSTSALTVTMWLIKLFQILTITISTANKTFQ